MSLHITPTVGALVGLPPPIALLGTLAFVFFLFWRDIRQKPDVTSALWLPVIWVVLMGSRSVVQWLNILHLPIGLGSMEEGNPLDALVYSMLIAAGLYVLNNRQVSLSEVFQNNGWLMAFLLYCFIAIFWSDFAFVAFKRWIKVLGHPIMALIVFTEPNPGEALTRLMKRSAYFLVPLSIMAIKWFPDIGRRYDDWAGLEVNVGITQSKNMLGSGCLVLGFFFIWCFIRTWRTEKSKARRGELRLLGVLLAMIAYLFRKSHDATATLCLLIALAVMLFVGRRWVNKKLIGTYVLMALGGLVVAELAFGIFERVADLSGHESTLMGRMELWRDCLAVHTNPLFGVGFESFWLGDRLHMVKEGRPWLPTEAHNGYLETYLNLGWVGLFMLFGLIVATFRKIRLDLLLGNTDWGRFELAFLVAMIFYNLTEATFRGLSLTWFVFFIIAMKYPTAEHELEFQPSKIDGLEEERKLIYMRE
jgi:exopolysaccharide production protein ExoQ